MPRARCPESIEAEKRYKTGEKLVDIARSLQVPEGTVRRWKSSQDWDGKKAAATQKKQSERSETKASVRKQNTQAEPIPPSVDQRLAAAVEENEELTDKQRLFCYCYMKNFNASQAARNAGYSNDTAGQIGYQLLQKDIIRKEISELKRIKNDWLGGLCGDDVVELHMRIAFANFTDFADFKGKTVPVTYKGEVVTMEHPDTGKRLPVTETVNVVRLKDSDQVDGQLISELSEGREGVKLKLRDSNRSMAFLERYFTLNPMDQHKKEYDNKKQELDRLRLEVEGVYAGAGSDEELEDVVIYLPDNGRGDVE